MLLRLRFLFCALLLCSLPGHAHGRDGASVCATISACATVVEPIGLIPGGQLPRSPSISAPAGSFDYLLVSPTRGITLNVDGVPIDLSRRLTVVSELLSGLYLESRPTDVPFGRTIVLTLIYSEN